jgi:hypothetical protein
MGGGGEGGGGVEAVKGERARLMPWRPPMVKGAQVLIRTACPIAPCPSGGWHRAAVEANGQPWCGRAHGGDSVWARARGHHNLKRDAQIGAQVRRPTGDEGQWRRDRQLRITRRHPMACVGEQPGALEIGGRKGSR